jgi:hypothetical protein
VRLKGVPGRISIRRLTLATLASVLALAGCSTTPTAPSESTPAASTGSVNSDTVSLNGLTMTLPSGWVEATPAVCRQMTNNSVTVYGEPPRPAACPSQAGRLTPTANVALVPIWGAWGSQGWSGTTTSWKGQPARVQTSTVPGDAQPTTTMALPLLNVAVIISNVDATETADLLAHMTPRLGTGLGVPTQASRVTVTHASNAGHKDTTDQPEITRILAAMTAVTTSTTAQPCPTTTDYLNLQDSVIVTLTDGTTDTNILITNAADCSQVAGGNGQAGPTTPELLTALAKYSFPHLG